jgi:hypothetical protein
MNRIGLAVGVLILLFAGCAIQNNTQVDRRNFAVDSFFPTPLEAQLAEGRARKYWDLYGSRFGPEPRYLAVEAARVFSTELGTDLWNKLIHSETSGSFLSRNMDQQSQSNLDLSGVLLFDIRSNRLVDAHQGYIASDTPQRGRVIRFDEYYARYIGTGK